jgi:hypothetical protein
MPDDTFIDLVNQVDRHEGELERGGRNIETLRKEIAALKSDIQNLVHFAHHLAKTRPIDYHKVTPEAAQADRFNELLENLLKRYPLIPFP